MRKQIRVSVFILLHFAFYDVNADAQILVSNDADAEEPPYANHLKNIVIDKALEQLILMSGDNHPSTPINVVSTSLGETGFHPAQPADETPAPLTVVHKVSGLPRASDNEPTLNKEHAGEADVLLSDSRAHTHSLGAHPLPFIHPFHNAPPSYPHVEQHPGIIMPSGEVLPLPPQTNGIEAFTPIEPIIPVVDLLPEEVLSLLPQDNVIESLFPLELITPAVNSLPVVKHAVHEPPNFDQLNNFPGVPLLIEELQPVAVVVEAEPAPVVAPDPSIPILGKRPVPVPIRNFTLLYLSNSIYEMKF